MYPASAQHAHPTDGLWRARSLHFEGILCCAPSSSADARTVRPKFRQSRADLPFTGDKSPVIPHFGGNLPAVQTYNAFH